MNQAFEDLRFSDASSEQGDKILQAENASLRAENTAFKVAIRQLQWESKLQATSYETQLNSERNTSKHLESQVRNLQERIAELEMNADTDVHDGRQAVKSVEDKKKDKATQEVKTNRINSLSSALSKANARYTAKRATLEQELSVLKPRRDERLAKCQSAIDTKQRLQGQINSYKARLVFASAAKAITDELLSAIEQVLAADVGDLINEANQLRNE